MVSAPKASVPSLPKRARYWIMPPDMVIGAALLIRSPTSASRMLVPLLLLSSRVDWLRVMEEVLLRVAVPRSWMMPPLRMVAPV